MTVSDRLGIDDETLNHRSEHRKWEGHSGEPFAGESKSSAGESKS